MIAIVWMFGGSPPPANPYGKWHADADSSVNALMIDMPDRRIKCRDFIHTNDMQLEGPPRGLLAVDEVVAGAAVDPFDHTTALDMLEANEGIATERDPPCHGTPEVCSKQGAVAPYGGIARH